MFWLPGPINEGNGRAKIAAFGRQNAHHREGFPEMVQPTRGVTSQRGTQPVRASKADPRDTTVSPFASALNGAHSKQLREQMQSLLDRILELSDRLGSSLSRETMDEYREAVRGFLKQVIDRSVSLKRDARNGNLLSVRTINSSLERLGEMVVEREQDRLRILDEVGQVRGMLISIQI